MDSKKWFKEAKFGLMIHWGLYSILGGEYRGQRMDYIGEWIQSKYHIPNAEYSKLAECFNPIYFDAEEWVLTAKAAGMKYIVVTSKHHEGFCLFKSDYDDFNVVDGTPFKRDIIGDLAEACKKHDMKLGLYYSQEIDWHEPNGGGIARGRGTNMGMDWTNCWDWPDDDKKDFADYFKKKTLFQVRELLTKYGDICLMWFDTPGDITPEQSDELYNLVKSLQPDCLINTRIGNGRGDYKSMGDNQIPDEYMSDILAESPTTLNKTWGFKYFDDQWKDAKEVARIKKHLNDRGVNYLLNVGPDHLGRLPAPAVEILKEVGAAEKE